MNMDDIILLGGVIWFVVGLVSLLVYRSVAVGLVSWTWSILFFMRPSLRDVLQQANLWAILWLTLGVMIIIIRLVRYRRFVAFALLLTSALFLVITDLFIDNPTKVMKFAVLGWLLIALLVAEVPSMYKGLSASLVLRRILVTHKIGNPMPEGFSQVMQTLRETQGDGIDHGCEQLYAVVLVGALLTL